MNDLQKDELKIISVSDDLRKFINNEFLYREDLYYITEYDLKSVFDKIMCKNLIRVNSIRIDANLINELFDLISAHCDTEFNFGELEIDITNSNFNIKDFVNKYKNILYSLKIVLNSIENLNGNDMEFLAGKYGITYIYCNEEYHFDEIIKILNYIEDNFRINTENIDLESANLILEKVSQKIKLYKPEEKKVDTKKPVEYFIKILEDDKFYTQLINIVKENIASQNGITKICKEALKLNGFKVIDNVESINSFIIRPDLIIDNEEYYIIVEDEKLNLTKFA